jgi:hypothetical protein
MLAAAASIGLAMGWIAGSWQPWALWMLIVCGVLAAAWIFWNIIQFQQDMDEWQHHAETARRLLEEAEDEDEEREG